MGSKKNLRTPKGKVQHPKARTRQSAPPIRLVLAGLAVGGLLVSATVFAIARSDDGPSASSPADDSGPVHVHGLGIDPADASLLIATHTGTYRVARNQRRPERIGDSRQDTMGFTVAGPNHFLGSGHPDAAEAVERNLPPHLGLIESRDAGRTWRTIALGGEADFHVLRFAKQRIYGYDASNDRLLVSGDKGTTWRSTARPAPVLDLAVDPSNAGRLVASGEGGLYGSSDEGRTWTALAQRIGLLGWPLRERLYLIDAGGAVMRSADAGRRWVPIGQVGGAPSAFLAQTASELYVALHDGTVMQSLDGGRTWSIRSTP